MAALSGWVRTGESFPPTPRSRSPLSPVCRFHSSATRRFALLLAANADAPSCSWRRPPASYPNFSGYIEEYAAAFYVDLPDATGACPAGTVPVFRLWNQRLDSNHRYTTNPAIVAQMQARNYVLEGSAPNFAAMCAAP
jgi:hypothetical protein